VKRTPLTRRTRLSAVSRKRKAQAGQRVQVREIVAERAGGRCEYAPVIPEVPCGMLPGRGMEVDEMRGGSYRSTEWLDPDACRYTCPVHHDYKTAHKRTVLSRLEVGS
jgi:hypothetical protein